MGWKARLGLLPLALLPFVLAGIGISSLLDGDTLRGVLLICVAVYVAIKVFAYLRTFPPMFGRG